MRTRRSTTKADPVAQIRNGTRRAGKDYAFDDEHDPSRPAGFWFQETPEGTVLFAVFYTLACRWSRCLGCNLPARMSSRPVPFDRLMQQVDRLLAEPEIQQRSCTVRKVIVSNNGSVLDEATFSSTALIYLIAQLNLLLPRVEVLSLETRVEYVDVHELEFIARALIEGDTRTTLELAIGFEAFDDRIRNERFGKGLARPQFERLCRMLARHEFRLKCYFMLKPVPEMSDDDAVRDIHQAIDYLSRRAVADGVQINVHLNPTYVAFNTPLEQAFRDGDYEPPRLRDLARAALAAEGRPLTLYLGLSDEGLACPGGSFARPGEESLLAECEQFNRTQDFDRLRAVVNGAAERGG